MKELYILRVLSGARFGKMKEAMDNVKRNSGQSNFKTFFDMIGCTIRYGAGYNDYDILHFYDIPAKLRKTYVTRLKNKRIIMACNDQNVAPTLHYKSRFNRAYEKYLGREWFDIQSEDKTLEDFKKFISYEKDISFFVVFNLLFYTGIREGELLALTYKDTNNFYSNLLIHMFHNTIAILLIFFLY